MTKVYLVGAGPGDPDLITVRGRNVLARADAVLYDHLASPALLHLTPSHAERIYVGKKRAEQAHSQEEIIALMIELARAGRTVVRLKGGDPFIFGRGGEEVEALADAGISYEVVPGVTAPLGIAATTGVPLTHREHTSAVTFVTGHCVESVDWSRIGLSETLVVFMGLQHLGEIVDKLVAAGRSPETPAMAVRWGTRPDQRTVTGRLADLPRVVADAHLLPPATVIIGDVVRLRERLDWFEKRPLFGTRVIVTRAAEQAGDLSERLRELGADAVELPVIELAPLEDTSQLDACIARLADYDWVIFTSVNAVSYFFARGVDARAIRGRICAIGPATAAVLRDAHLMPDLIPEASTSEGVAHAFAGVPMEGARVLLPRAAAARELIPETLRAMGAHVDIADAYRNVIPRDAAARIKAWDGRADWIAFTSGSTVKNWLALAGPESLHGVRIVTIGPATSDVARKHGLHVDAEASPHTIDGLVDAVLARISSPMPR
jgi:uroporphyrinogen III methyltransferase / synthase